MLFPCHSVTLRVRKVSFPFDLEYVWSVMAHAQKPNLVFQTNGWVHLNQRGSHFSRLLAVEQCGSARRPWIDHVPSYGATVVATLSNRLFSLHFLSHASTFAITFPTASTQCGRVWFTLSMPCSDHAVLSSEINPTRCNNCVYSSQWLYSTCFGWQFHPSSGVQECRSTGVLNTQHSKAQHGIIRQWSPTTQHDRQL